MKDDDDEVTFLPIFKTAYSIESLLELAILTALVSFISEYLFL